MTDVPIMKTPLRLNFSKIVDADGKVLVGHSLDSRPRSMEELVRRANAYKEFPSVEDLRKLAGHYHDGPYRSGKVVALLENTIEAILDAEATFRRQIDGVWSNEN